MKETDISFSADIMTPKSGMAGQYTFDLWIVATKSLNKVKKEVTLGLNYCIDMPTITNPEPQPSSVEIQINKQKSGSFY